MTFFEPLTQDHIAQSMVATDDNRSPAWTEDPGARTTRDEPRQRVELDNEILFMDRRILILIDELAIGAKDVRLKLRVVIREWSPGMTGVSPGFPWAVTRAPHESHDQTGVFSLGNRPEDICRFGVSYPNGAKAMTGTGFKNCEFAWGEEDIGSQSSDRLRMLFAGHGGQQASLKLWPPPVESMTLHIEWPAMDIPETNLTITSLPRP